ncbi:MAG TPA: ATP-binding cassette domain-containing protein [Thermoanaerobaculia bacterium]|nr:ATP-binding cassette domain-containing protein [Thermoanaerobaculia bacterium]HPA96204.1 ATP-binding cassette domain-containing protein [Thermoanaerobaculia bacterium]HQN37984.1 ATP-binding cassette domain-containing protein [Thermoanaerobaculia bacterium]HRR14980.1 ATP-binding cassette domain-containing protein [Thermoanaerobaculia bacterium]HRS35271.1 ATP-binding cassette domain-containing protein [Thermoanaerobaculia bacterium]
MSICVQGLTKRYDRQPVVADFSLTVPAGELCVLLGPSGSGKSTVLRIIAGLLAPDAGRVSLHGRDVTGLPPQARGAGFVFQSYALFRSMTVAENVGFALAVRGVPRAERRHRVDELLELVGLGGLGRRLPRQLSGGQQQRVALARALAHRPEVLLLDEPFGALDARIRAELRRSLREIQRELGIATLFVTHDQEEAFALADRIAVMALGRLVETGTPRELYLRPQTEFVATFLGAANLLVGEATARGVRIGPVDFPLGGDAGGEGAQRRVQVLFRPEDVALVAPGAPSPAPLLGTGTVESCAFAGALEQLRLRLPPFVGVRAIAPPVPFGAGSFAIVASRPPHEAHALPLAPGDEVGVAVRRLHALAHPGLQFLLLAEPSPEGLAAVGWAGELTRRTHARLAVLLAGLPEETARQRLGSGLPAVTFHPVRGVVEAAVAELARLTAPDLLLAGAPPGRGATLGASLLATGAHHLLLVRAEGPLPERALVCAAVGEPGKEDVAFTGRLLRHLGTHVTVLTVLPAASPAAPRTQAERFLTASARTLEPLGVPAATRLGEGDPEAEILAVLAGGAELLVLGVPLPKADGALSLDGIAGRLVERTGDLPLLVIRSFPEMTT